MTGVEMIAAERTRQVEKMGYTGQRDASVYDEDDLRAAAACYAVAGTGCRVVRLGYELIDKSDGQTMHMGVDAFPWDPEDDKRQKHRLAIAGALIAAEIDRLQAEASK